MLESGIELYPEADKFLYVCGTLLSHLLCNSESDRDNAGDAYRTAISGLTTSMVAYVKIHYPEGEPGTLEQTKHNFTIAVIRRLSHKFRKRSYTKIRLWKG